jgi:hypothetical protein
MTKKKESFYDFRINTGERLSVSARSERHAFSKAKGWENWIRKRGFKGNKVKCYLGKATRENNYKPNKCIKKLR